MSNVFFQPAEGGGVLCRVSVMLFVSHLCLEFVRIINFKCLFYFRLEEVEGVLTMRSY